MRVSFGSGLDSRLDFLSLRPEADSSNREEEESVEERESCVSSSVCFICLLVVVWSCVCRVQTSSGDGRLLRESR